MEASERSKVLLAFVLVVLTVVWVACEIVRLYNGICVGVARLNPGVNEANLTQISRFLDQFKESGGGGQSNG